MVWTWLKINPIFWAGMFSCTRDLLCVPHRPRRRIAGSLVGIRWCLWLGTLTDVSEILTLWTLFHPGEVAPTSPQHQAGRGCSWYSFHSLAALWSWEKMPKRVVGLGQRPKEAVLPPLKKPPCSPLPLASCQNDLIIFGFMLFGKKHPIETKVEPKQSQKKQFSFFLRIQGSYFKLLNHSDNSFM